MEEAVTVIVPMYQAENDLVRCVESIKKQSVKELQIVLVDDGSYDRTAYIADCEMIANSQITVIHTRNRGVSEARNIGMQCAACDLIMFVDSDDFIDSPMIEVMRSKLNQSGSDLCISGITDNKFGRDFSIEVTSKYEKELVFIFKNHLVFGPVCKLYKKQIIDSHKTKFPAKISFGEDMDFNLQYLSHANSVNYVDRCFYHYQQNNVSSLSKRIRWNMFDEGIALERKLLNWMEKKGILDSELRKFMANRIYGLAADSIALCFYLDCPLRSFKERREYIKHVLGCNLMKWSIEYADTTAYAGWIVFSIRHRLWLVFEFAWIMKRKGLL